MSKFLSSVFTLAALSLPAAFSADEKTPNIPKAIALPAGYQEVHRLEAKGMQVYKAEKDEAGQLKWVHQAPIANLYDKEKKVGTHYAGPAWEAADGSKVLLDKSQKPQMSPASNSKKDVPLLLLKVKADDGAKGTFSEVVYIHRLNTKSGVAPSEKPRRVGSIVGVPYKATYILYAPTK